MKLKVKRTGMRGRLPSKKTAGSAGYDLYLPCDVTVKKGVPVSTNMRIAIAVPEGYVGLIKERSSLGAAGLTCLAGVIDSDYRGDLVVVMASLNTIPFIFKAGDRVCQLLLVKHGEEFEAECEECEELPPTVRGEGGFGSTGK